MAEFVKFQVPEALRTLQAEVLGRVNKSGKIKIGINEVTKTIERGTAKLVLIAEDVSPAEVVMHIPVLCKNKNVPFSYVLTREELGKVVGISAKASSIAVTDEGVVKKEFASLLDKISEIYGGKKPKVEVKEEKKTEAKVEKKTEAKVEKKTEAKVETKAEVKVETKAEVKEEPKTEAKVETKAEVKEEPKTEAKVETKAEVKEEKKTEVKE
jgi:large subunit ribosomal protein L7Ae